MLFSVDSCEDQNQRTLGSVWRTKISNESGVPALDSVKYRVKYKATEKNKQENKEGRTSMCEIDAFS